MIDYDDMNNQEEVRKELVEFVNKELGTRFSSLDENVQIEKDLKLAGDDTVDFIVSFAEKFGVDISELDLAKYSSGEGLMISLNVIKQKMRGQPVPPIMPLTIKDLMNAVLTKKLV